MSYTISALAAFLVIFGFDFLWHGNLLADLYSQTAHLWRSKEEMMSFLPIAMGFQFLIALVLTYIYSLNYQNKGPLEGLRFGLTFGILTGIMQVGIYPYMPIPLELAGMWFLGSFIEVTLVGIILGFTFKKKV